MSTIQSIHQNRKTTPIRIHNLALQPFGSWLNDENEDEAAAEAQQNTNKRKKDKQEFTGGQESYIDALEKSKTTARERAGFLFNKPKKPEMDEDRRKNFKNLSKAGAIAQLVDAVGSIAMGAKNNNYQPVPISGDELAFSGLQEVYNMDENFRNELKQYGDQVFRIDQQNKQNAFETEQKNVDAKQRANQFNKGVDIKKAEARLNFKQANDQAKLAAQKIQSMKDKTEYDRLSDLQKRYIYRGDEFYQNGDTEAAIAMYEKGGLDTKDVQGLFDLHSKEKSSTINRLNNYMGYDGKKKSVTDLQIRMMRQYKGLQEKIDKDGYDVHFNVATGDPMTSTALDLLDLKKELGSLRFAPDEMFVENETTIADGSTIQESRKKQSGLSSSQRESIAADNIRILNEIASAEKMSEEELAPLRNRLVENGKRLGLSEDQVFQELNQIANPDSEYNQSMRSRFQSSAESEPNPKASIDTKEGQNEVAQYANEVRTAFLDSEDKQQKADILMEFGRELEQRGIPEDDIHMYIQNIISSQESANPGAEVKEGTLNNEYGYLPSGLSKEEFVKEALNKPSARFEGGDSAKTARAISGTLSFLNDRVTYIRNVLGSALKAPIDILRLLSEAEQQKVEEEYQKYLQSQQ